MARSAGADLCEEQMSGNTVKIEQEERWFKDGVDVDVSRVAVRQGEARCADVAHSGGCATRLFSQSVPIPTGHM